MLRLYVKQGCPWCDKTKALLNTICDFETIDVQDDPVLLNGLMAIQGTTDLPVLISLSGKEVVRGFKEEELIRVANNHLNHLQSSAIAPELVTA